jgi:hypothetical protein
VAAWLNQHSYLAATAGLLILVAALLFRDGVRPTDLLALAALAAGAWVAYALLQPGASTLDRAESIRAEIGAGRPVLLEFQSPY